MCHFTLNSYYSLYADQSNSLLIFPVKMSKNIKSANKNHSERRKAKLKHENLIMNKYKYFQQENYYYFLFGFWHFTSKYQWKNPQLYDALLQKL